ncbi:hypothetical protein ABBQ38_011354 [Trebouxia sp. C0009 RCD-2024]
MIALVCCRKHGQLRGRPTDEWHVSKFWGSLASLVSLSSAEGQVSSRSAMMQEAACEGPSCQAAAPLTAKQGTQATQWTNCSDEKDELTCVGVYPSHSDTAKPPAGLKQWGVPSCTYMSPDAEWHSSTTLSRAGLMLTQHNLLRLLVVRAYSQEAACTPVKLYVFMAAKFFQVPYQMAGGQVCPGVCKAAKLDVPMECPLTRLDLTEQVHQKINAVTRLVPLHAAMCHPHKRPVACLLNNCKKICAPACQHLYPFPGHCGVPEKKGHGVATGRPSVKVECREHFPAASCTRRPTACYDLIKDLIKTSLQAAEPLIRLALAKADQLDPWARASCMDQEDVLTCAAVGLYPGHQLCTAIGFWLVCSSWASQAEPLCKEWSTKAASAAVLKRVAAGAALLDLLFA